MPAKKTSQGKKLRHWFHKLPYLFLLLLVFAVAGGLFYVAHKPKVRDIYPDTVSSFSLHLNKVASNHQIEGYTSLSSVAPGGSISFQISCDTDLFTTEIYRTGWYGGTGAHLITDLGDFPCWRDKIPEPDKTTGLVNLKWPTNFRLHIPPSWEPGIYLAKLTGSDGYQNYVPFTVRTVKPHSKYLFVHALNTDNAYNLWGGNSLYEGFTPALKIHRAVEASLNRPFLMPGGGDDGSGDFLEWEYPMISFLEKNGYQVDYATDIDIHEHPDILLKYRAVIITGHDEYWSRQMLDGYKAAVAHGVNLAIFAANTAYRPIRFEPDPLTGEQDRIMVNYKSAALDPFAKTNPKYSTPAGWQSSPLNDPPSELLGDSYGGETMFGAANKSNAPLMVSDGSSWIFKGTGLKTGDVIPGIVGYEFDKFINSSPHPSNTDIVFHSPLININKKTDFADSTYYKLPSGGQVFDAGTIEWSWGVDSSRSTYSPELVKVTENILNSFGS